MSSSFTCDLPMCAPPLVMKEPCVVCVDESVLLTDYIQLCHAVFDAAAVSRHAGVPARVICGDICDQQGAIGHLLEPGGEKVQMRAQVWSSETQEKQEGRRGRTECIQPNILQSSTLKCFYLPHDSFSTRPTPINAQTSLFHADERCPSTSRCRHIR